jgi:hypothetical protein
MSYLHLVCDIYANIVLDEIEGAYKTAFPLASV